MRAGIIAGSLLLFSALAAPRASAQENWTAVVPLELYKPDYFLMGQPDTKIQFSFKLRLVQGYPLYFGYSQVMKWDLVRPDPFFADLNYNPEFFYRFALGDSKTRWLDAGPFEHESNGKGGSEERSWNRSYLRFHDEWTVGDKTVLRAELKAWVPYSLNVANRDLPDYRGVYETNVILSNFMGPRFDVDDLILRLYPGGPSNVDPTRGGQELTWRMRSTAHIRIRPVLVFQVFHGYAETMLDYRHSYWAWRAGIGF